MFLFGPLDPLLAVLYTAYRLRRARLARAAVLALGMIPAGLYALPARPCSCIIVPFVRCSSYGRELAHFAAMKSDLKNLASQQEIFHSDHNAYSVSQEDLGFVSSDGVDVTVVATGDGWAARATHGALPEDSCAMFSGSPPPVLEELIGAQAGALVCSRR